VRGKGYNREENGCHTTLEGENGDFCLSDNWKKGEKVCHP